MKFAGLLIAAVAAASDSCEVWRQCEVTLEGPKDGNPFVDVDLSARFELDGADDQVEVRGFYDGDGLFRIRFAPPQEGTWSYKTTSNVDGMSGLTGQIAASTPSPENHGPVHADGFALRFADGSPYFSVGTTSYQWASMNLAMQKQTLRTLKDGQGNGQVFNKMRMTVFPKWYVYNYANPVEVGTAYEIIDGSAASEPNTWNCEGNGCPAVDGSFDLQRFNVSYWQNFESLLQEMQDLNVIADIIVFHPYDGGHWGFDCMGGRDKDKYNTTNDEFYLQYLGARLSSFSNVWWSMANEWDAWNPNDCKAKDVSQDDGPSPTWDKLFHTLGKADPYGRMTGIHNGKYLYNHSQPWITHVSIQGLEDQTPELRARYGKPVIWDEVRYEGDIDCCSWGSLSGAEMADRFWWGASLGVWVGHSETVLHPDVAEEDHQPLWWAKGGELIGESPERIRWFRSLWQHREGKRPEFPSLTPSIESFGSAGGDVANMISKAGEYYAMRFKRMGKWRVPLATSADASAQPWEVRFMNYWNMTVTVLKTLPANATHADVLVESTPYNVEIARQAADSALVI